MTEKYFPYYELQSYKRVFIDVDYVSNSFSIRLTFISKFSDEEDGPDGLVIMPNVYADTIEELRERVDTLSSMGMLGWTDIDTRGRLYDNRGEEIQEFDWNDLPDLSHLPPHDE